MNLESFIPDNRYLSALQRRFADRVGLFCGYGAETPNLQSSSVDWEGTDTYIQRDGINRDFGLFDTPDAFYARRSSNLRGPKLSLFVHVVRHLMNRNVEAVRAKLYERHAGTTNDVRQVSSVHGQ